MMILGNQYARKSTVIPPSRSPQPQRVSASAAYGSSLLNSCSANDALLADAERRDKAKLSLAIYNKSGKLSTAGIVTTSSTAHAVSVRHLGKKRTAAATVERRYAKASVASHDISINVSAVDEAESASASAQTIDEGSPLEDEETVVAARAPHVAATPSPVRTPPSRRPDAIDNRKTSSAARSSVASKKASTATFDSEGDVRLYDGEALPEEEQLAHDDYDEEPTEQNEGAEGATEVVTLRSRIPFGAKLVLLFLLYYGILSVYILLGAVIIRAFELPFEQKTRANSDSHSVAFLEFVRNQTAGFWNESDLQDFKDQLDGYTRMIEHKVRCGFVSNEERWSLINSMFYVGTLVTTIGYGQIAPVTEGGRIFTVIISLIGIPLLMLNVAHLGMAISHFIEELLSFLRRRFNLTLISDSEAKGPQRYHIPLSLAFLVIVIYILAMSGIIAATEGWFFVDAVYFTFITLATVGLGDLVPDHPLLLLVFSVFIVFGLTLVTIFIELSEFQLERRLISLRRVAREIITKASVIFRTRAERNTDEEEKINRASFSKSPSTVTSPC